MSASLRKALALAAVVVLALVAWCRGPGSDRALSRPERTVVRRWLLCEDCTDGELDSLLSLAGRKPDPTLSALKQALGTGPSQSQKDNVRQQADQGYTADSLYLVARNNAPAQPRAARVGRLVDNYEAVYRARAGIALKRTGRPDARAFADSAVADTLRADSLIARRVAAVLGRVP